MVKQEPQADERMLVIADRILAALVKKGWTQERLEVEARLGQGRLSRLLKGKQTRVHVGTMKRLEDALGLAPGSLAAGLNLSAASAGESSRLSPSLDQIDGYMQAEFQVARLEPQIPFEVFLEARATRWQSPPALITVDFLRNYVRFLHEHMFGDTKVEQSDVQGSPAHMEAKPARKRRA
jgi:transcriptional regulator with XRE-family HTH domain